MSDKTTKKSNRERGFSAILPCARGYVLPTLLTPVLMIFEVAMEVFIPLLMAAIVDGGLYRKPDFQLKALFPAELIADNTRFILTLGALMIAAALFSLFFGMLGARTAAVAAMGFSKNLRHSIFKKIQSFSFKNTDKFSTPSLVMRATADVNNIQNLYMQAIRVFVRAPAMMVLAAVMAFRIDAKLSLVFVCSLPVLVFVLIIFATVGRPRFRIYLKKYDALNASVQEDLTAVRVVKSYVREDYEKSRFNASADDLKRAHIRAERLFALTNPLQLGVMWTCSIILLLLGGDRVLGGRLNTGELVSMLTYTNQVIGALAMVAAMIVIFAITRESVARITEVLAEVPDIPENDSETRVESGEVEFKNVCFSYTGSEDNLTLRNIDLHIRSGETIGIIGGTGEGKSTLVQLIPRFYDILSGELLIGGRDIKEYSLYELRESVSMVLQKNMLFSGTIKDNLRWGDENASDEDIEKACRLACAHDFITGFPNGYDTELGQGGVNVSGGQKQRLCIARALLKKPKILILDDSTSAVDSRTDESIRKAFREFIPSTTKLIIAQRISSIMDADRIIVMKEGAISDIGTHDELMERSEIYREVYTSQHKEAAANE